jgi:hypothetical protein
LEVGFTHTFYVDEAGHAGANYLDSDQPFHIAGGFLVPEHGTTTLDRGLQVVTGESSEIRGSRLTRTRRGQELAATAIHSLREDGATPFFWALERSYCIAGKLVDVFLDPDYYPECAWLPVWDYNKRDEVSQLLAVTAPAELLDDFGRAYRRPQRDAWQSVLERLVDSLRQAREAMLADTFESAQRVLDDIIEREDMGADHAEHAALNIPALVQVLRLVDRYVEWKGGTFRTVHDQNVQFEHRFRWILQALSVEPDCSADFAMPNGRVERLLLGRLRSLEFGDSKNSRGLQAADLLVSSIARVTKGILTPPEQWRPATKKLAREVLPPIMGEIPTFGGMYAKTDTKVRLVIAMTVGDDPVPA